MRMRRLQADAAEAADQGGLAAAAAPGREARTGGLPGWLIAAVPAVAELAVGGYRIGAPSLWRDEAATISGSQRPVGAIFSLVRNQDAVHGLYYLLMHPLIAAFGTSETALRLPSLIAMCLGVGLTAVLGRRLAAAAEMPRPDLVGLLGGLLLVAVPLTTRYAQEARPYALTTLFAVLATYLLLHAAERDRWPWWTGYAAALALACLFNMFAVLLAAAHGVSLLAARGGSRRPHAERPSSAGLAGDVGGPVDAAGDVGWTVGHGAATDTRPTVAGRVLWHWLVAGVAAAVVVAPVAFLSAAQSAQLNWITAPTASTVASLLRDFAGTTLLVPLVGLVALVGCAAGLGIRRGSGLTLAAVCLPWLVLPPVLLLAVSFAHPLFVERYVVFCLPALALLTSAGLVWLGALAGKAARDRGLTGPQIKLASVAPPAVLAVAMAAALIGPQADIRQATARPDDLRAVAAVVAAHEKPGDAVIYLPWDAELVGVAYPAPFRSLRDVGHGESPLTSATIRGLSAAPSIVAARLGGVTRLWTVQWARPLPGESAASESPLVQRVIAAMHLVRRWRVQSVLLTLYVRR